MLYYISTNICHLESLLPFKTFNHLDDTAFNTAIYELEHGPLNFYLDSIEYLIFNPIEH